MQKKLQCTRVEVIGDYPLNALPLLRTILDRQFVIWLIKSGCMIVDIDDFNAKRARVRKRMRFSFVLGLDSYAILV